MIVRFTGTCAALEFDDRGWLRLEWAEPGHDHWYQAGELRTPVTDCLALTLRPDPSDGRLHMAFRFRRPGGTEAYAELAVVAQHAADAVRFAEYLAQDYRVEVARHDPTETGDRQLGSPPPDSAPVTDPPARDAVTGTGTGQDDSADWLSAPVSAGTQTLFRSVLTRLSGTAR
ncbi:hypothetical protein DSC45_18995 [Streptomyces sp. YIM 130001]|uniref:hypothetical protein n=1 Tax=Streptomyces sp. YIM 130001 TaxID=2259644 RepID=UPI000E64C502|nr:hypothetical protein [Streptomyces sp. YIM 130001]RII14984.1 hypothetical protein DSC45_18995 [Streptomyces sp. YIM 130001]